MAKAGHGMGHDTSRGVEHVADVPDNITREDELASRRMGDNELQGDDQVRVHNERQTQAGMRTEPPETDRFVDKHETGLRSDDVAPNEAQIRKETDKG